MKKRRRIEITVFRRRTTVVLREGAGAGPARWPPVDGEATRPPRADPAPAEEITPDQTRTTGAGAAEQSGLRRGDAGGKVLGRTGEVLGKRRPIRSLPQSRGWPRLGRTESGRAVN